MFFVVFKHVFTRLKLIIATPLKALTSIISMINLKKKETSRFPFLNYKRIILRN
jgi:hypothetical protein